MYITASNSKLFNLLPVEVAWWWLHRVGVVTASWVLIVAQLPHLAAHVAVRSGVGLCQHRTHRFSWVVMGDVFLCQVALQKLCTTGVKQRMFGLDVFLTMEDVMRICALFQVVQLVFGHVSRHIRSFVCSVCLCVRYCFQHHVGERGAGGGDAGGPRAVRGRHAVRGEDRRRAGAHPLGAGKVVGAQTHTFCIRLVRVTGIHADG